MNLHGSLNENLRTAVASVKRHQGHRVHQDTANYWEQLLSYARDKVRSGRANAGTAELVRQLSLGLIDRNSSSAVLRK